MLDAVNRSSVLSFPQREQYVIFQKVSEAIIIDSDYIRRLIGSDENDQLCIHSPWGKQLQVNVSVFTCCIIAFCQAGHDFVEFKVGLSHDCDLGAAHGWVRGFGPENNCKNHGKYSCSA